MNELSGGTAERHIRHNICCCKEQEGRRMSRKDEEMRDLCFAIRE
jgi:hypothetical protein